MNRVVLDKLEGRWLSRNVLKTRMILEAAATKDPEVLNRTTYKTIASLGTQAAEISTILAQLGEEPYEFEFLLTPKQKLVLRQMIENTVKALTEQILPEYQKRGLTDYETDTVSKIALLTKLERKLK